MENFLLKLEDFGTNEVLSRAQLKSVIGGLAPVGVDCKQYKNEACGGGYSIYTCTASSVSDCQTAADALCEASDCCDDVDCQ